MAEVKNAFIKSKMNKDLDDRLLPSGEYRDAVNAQVSKSEGSDVGALENVLGNALVADFTQVVATAVVTNVYASIGIAVGNVSGSILAGYKVVTNDYANNITVVSASNSGGPTTDITFSEGVNFSVGQTISFAPNVSSIGYLADEFSNNVYIFLTDNDTIFYKPTGPGSNHYIFKYNTEDGSITKLVEGAFLNFSKLNPIFGVNLLEDLLFWTDNRNQPRKINVISASQNSTYYTNEDQISVAKYYPHQTINLYKGSSLSEGDYESTMKDVVSKNLPNGGSATCSAVNNLSTFVISNLSILVYPNEPLNGFTIGYVETSGEIILLSETISSYNSGTNELTLTGPVTIPPIGSGTELVFNVNPYYKSNYSGDDSFLEDKFVRFSYRFKFDDGEYSLLAPFTQICFIPKQDGYFLNTTVSEGDEKEAFDSTIVKFMENKVNQIDLQIPLPCKIEDLNSSFHITEIDIIYKESDGLSLQVVETIYIDNLSEDIDQTSDVIEYVYKAQKPYKTLPSNETTRVYDKVPVKALAQEVISNRIVYGNFLNKNNPPKHLDYNVACTQKSEFNLLNSSTSSVEYPSSSVKTNRNYQIGFVLADKFGRQSTVILSSNKENITVNGTTYLGSTLYSPYIDENIGANIDSWKGNSLKILLNQPITEGIYNEDITSESYNPTGWYSYKIVVKQTQQDYYNVYAAGALKGDPFDTTKDLNFTYLSLLNDNINKIPRDLSEVGPLQDQFRSSVRLFGRVDISQATVSSQGNFQFYPDKTFFTSAAVQNLFENFGVNRSEPATSYAELAVFQNWQSNPLVIQLSTSQSTNKQFGVTNTIVGSGSMSNLAILETAPTESRLDIFWETSTSGLISDINDKIGGDSLVSGFSNDYNVSLFNEGVESGDNISINNFTLIDPIGANIDSLNINDFTLASVFNTQSVPLNVSSYFQLTGPFLVGSFNYYNVSVTNEFINNVYYGSDQGARVWNFRFKAIVNNIESFIDKTISLNNVNPLILPPNDFTVQTDGSDALLATITATNGVSSLNANGGKELSWSIISGNNSNYFSLSITSRDNYSTCRLNNNLVNSLPAGVYNLTIRVTDAGGGYDEIVITINSSVQVNSITEYAYTTFGGLGELYYFTVLEVQDGVNNDRSGYYAYLGPWHQLSTQFNIVLDYTGASKNATCPIDSDFMFKDVFPPLAAASVCVTGDIDPQYVSEQAINFTGYTFTIV